MKTTLSKTVRSLLLVTALGAFAAATAQAGPMHKAAELTQQAHDVLKEDATSDKGGHRVAAMKLLKQALDEINAGVEFDKTHTGPNEGKKRKNN